MKLRTKIVIVTFFIILFVQGINCFLEIGFLFNNFEKKSINKYKIIGNEIKRKLDKSLAFGKPLTHINYKRLISSIIPSDVQNFYITDNSGKIIYSSKNSHQKSFPFYKSFTKVKTSDYYQVFIPLSDKTEVIGNILIVIPNKKIQTKLSELIKKSLITFLIIVTTTLPILFVLLTIFINTPYNLFIRNLNTYMAKEQYDKLKENMVDLTPIFSADEKIKTIRKGEWLSTKNESIYKPFDVMETGSNNSTYKNNIFKKFIRLLNTN